MIRLVLDLVGRRLVCPDAIAAAPRAAAVALCLALAACAGGEPGVGSSGTGLAISGTQIGSIDGFGSVIVAGTRYDDAGAEVVLDLDPAAATPSAADATRLGMRVELAFEADTRAARIAITPTVVGPLGAITADGPESTLLTVAGQPIRIGGGTARSPVIEGFESLTDLAIGDWLVVHGTRDDRDRIDATRIERLGVDAPRALRVVGDVAAIDAAGFAVGGLQVAIDPTTGWIPAAPVAPLAVGQRVTVFADPAAAVAILTGARVSATRVRIESTQDGRRLRVAGRIRSIDVAASRLRVENVLVDFAAARIDQGLATDLLPGARVRVAGEIDQGVLRADRLVVVRDADDETEVLGVVTDFVSAGSFRVRTTLVDASSPAVRFDQSSPSELADGLLVAVRGTIRDGVLRAARVAPVSTPDDRTRALLGTVSTADGQAVPADGSFAIAGVRGRLTEGATFRFGDGGVAARTDFFPGVRAVVQGRFEAGIFSAAAVTLLRDGERRTVATEGFAYQVDPTARTLRLNRLQVAWTAETTIEGNPARLRTGARVAAEGVVADGTLRASRLTLRD